MTPAWVTPRIPPMFRGWKAKLQPMCRRRFCGALLGLLVASALLALFAWWRFERRDIRVVGEGSWQLPSLPWRRAAEIG